MSQHTHTQNFWYHTSTVPATGEEVSLLANPATTQKLIVIEGLIVSVSQAVIAYLSLGAKTNGAAAGTTTPILTFTSGTSSGQSSGNFVLEDIDVPLAPGNDLNLFAINTDGTPVFNLTVWGRMEADTYALGTGASDLKRFQPASA